MTENIEIRKLAAVMFTDIQGYTSMFQEDESMTLKQVELHHRQIERIAEENKGHVIQYLGDGSLIIFDSVVDAVRSAVEIQQASIGQALPVRIGIHLGDLIYKNGTVYGDVVNLTSRLQAIGVPGSVV